MKKRIFAAVAGLLAVVLLAGCGPKVPETALAAYTGANTKMAEANSLAYDLEINMQMTVMGQKMDIAITGHVAQAVNDADNAQMAVLLSTKTMGVSIDMNVYYTGGSIYMDAMGQKVKAKADLEDMLKRATYTLDAATLEAALQEQILEETEDGYRLTFTLDGAAMGDSMNRMVSGMLGNMDVSVTVSDVEMTALVNRDGLMLSSEMVFTYFMEIQGQALEVPCTIATRNVQIGGVTVPLPDDLDSYTETDNIDSVTLL